MYLTESDIDKYNFNDGIKYLLAASYLLTAAPKTSSLARAIGPGLAKQLNTDEMPIKMCPGDTFLAGRMATTLAS